MSEHFRANDGSHHDGSHHDGSHHDGSDHDELTERIARALRSREVAQPDTAGLEAQIEARLTDRPHSVSDLTRRGGKAVVAGVVLSALAVGGAGAAAAANPYSGLARVVENAAQAVGLEWSAMPAGYTRAQYEAFWGAGYSAEDVDTLAALWSSDPTETKARAGQMILDGLTPPVSAAPEGTPEAPTPGDPSQAQVDAFFGAGYSVADVDKLDALWNLDASETKARAGQMILDGVPLPISPDQVG